MRLKLEEEYAQNTKNHEEEVQLRLKFEAKLNDMHGEYRDLNTKYQRTSLDLKETTAKKEELQAELNVKVDECVQLNQQIVDQQNRITNQVEKIQSLNREISIKAHKVLEIRAKIEKTQDELDLAAYKL